MGLKWVHMVAIFITVLLFFARQKFVYAMSSPVSIRKSCFCLCVLFLCYVKRRYMILSPTFEYMTRGRRSASRSTRDADQLDYKYKGDPAIIIDNEYVGIYPKL